MDVTFSEEQEALREAVAALLADHSNPRAASGSDTGADMELYGRLVELGAVELPGMVELGIVLEECGRALAAVPLASVAAASAVFPADDAVPVLGLDLELVADAHVATHVVYPHDGVLRVVASDAYEAAPRPTVDATRRLCAVRVTGPSDELGPAEPSLSRAMRRGCVALAHELVGIAQACLDMAVAHARAREQFGRPVGVFQAISHRCADMFVATESARSHAYFAAWALDAYEDGGPEPPGTPGEDGGPEPPGHHAVELAASQAKAAAGEAAVVCAQSAIQVHGGIGFTWEHDLHLYLKRALSGAALLGTPAEHRQRIAHLIL